jgi:hypothetical protein
MEGILPTALKPFPHAGRPWWNGRGIIGDFRQDRMSCDYWLNRQDRPHSSARRHWMRRSLPPTPTAVLSCHDFAMYVEPR